MLSTIGLLCCMACDPARPAAAATPVDVELVLAVDISKSMDAEEFALQRAGYVEAIRSPEFIAAVRGGLHGRIAISYFEWAQTISENSFINWQVIDSPESANAFADRLASRPYETKTGTSIAMAVSFGAETFAHNAYEGRRRVIDISGDGPNNTGFPVTDARDAAVARGIVINGLPIVIRPSPTFQNLDRYYAECVIGGQGSFVMPIRTKEAFATAIRLKLVLEVSGDTPPPSIIQIAETPVDCLQGERDPRFRYDPAYP